MKSGKKLLAGTLSALCILFAGCGKAAKNNAALPEIRNNGTAIQWKYSDETDWHDLVALDELRGAAGEAGKDGINGSDGKDGINGTNGKDGINGVDGKNGADGKNGKDGINGKDGADGQNGSDGKDGNTPFIGENGNWWIGETDTGVKAAGADGTDGRDGEKGDKGEPGEKGAPGEKGDKGDVGEKGEKGDKGDKGDVGEKGDKGDAGQNGGCAGYFHASNGGTGASFNQPLQLFEDCNSGGLFVWDRTNRTVTLKAGHTYSLSFSGSVCISHDMGGWYSVVLKGKQGILKDTLIERYMNDADNSRVWMPFAFNRIYSAGSDIVLQYEFIQLTPGTQLNGAVYNLTIIALD